MKYCVFRQWIDSASQEVLEYFETLKEAETYANKIKKSCLYKVHIGEFV